MDAHNSGQAPATDDQDLANVLAGISQDPQDGNGGLQFEETPAPAATSDDTTDETKTDDKPAEEAATEEPALDLPDLSEVSLPSPLASTDASSSTSSTASPELESLKKEALAELRPLVDKLSLPSDEKFDTLLLIIRSTDDQSLLSEAHEAAKAIEDETKRASALLDVIKEIDYFANQGK